MSSACVNHIQPATQYTSPTNYTTWFTNSPPSVTPLQQQPNASNSTSSSSDMNADFNQESSSSTNNNASDFNFQLSSSTVAMLPADELFSDGKLLPLHFPTPKPPPNNASLFPDANKPTLSLQNLKETPHLFSPKAPRCSSRLKELLGFRKTTTTSSTTSKSIKQLLYKNISKTTSSSSNTDASLNSPLLKHSSVSSSSSSSELQDDHPRHSLDSEKPNPQPAKPNTPAGPKLRPVRPKQAPIAPPPPMMESPRMNPSGRVVFVGLERSTSCPSSFNGGCGTKSHKGCYYKGTTVIERSYSANVNNRITPVLNVPVCSIRGSSKIMGFGQLFSSQKKDGVSYGGTICRTNHHCHVNVNGGKSKKEKEKPKESS